MKRKIALTVIALLLVLLIPLTLVLTAFAMPAQFGDSFYGQLPVLFEKLKNAQGRKLLLIGNSAVAFGVRSDLLERELPGYEVIPFGLYGAVGTKAMLELSKVNVSEGDLIVLLPELYAETCSLYFSAQDFWRAADGDREMLSRVTWEEKKSLAWYLPGYAAEKYAAWEGRRTPDAAGAYSRAAFLDEAGEYPGYMTYDRPCNVMAGGYDAVNLPRLDAGVFGEGFIEYLNEYVRCAEEQGATVCYGFAPMNELAVGEQAGRADTLYDYLSIALDCPVIGHPAKYLLDCRWFYDNNVHANSAGAVVYTDLLAEDLKLFLGIKTPNRIDLPEAPDLPRTETGAADNSDRDCFTWEVLSGAAGEYIRLTGLTEEGRTRTELTLPGDYDGIPVREFAPEVFQNNTTVSRIILPESITTIYDNSFSGATRLTELVFRHESVLGLAVGPDFLAGADGCFILVRKGVSTVDCAGGWARYQTRLRYY